MRNMLVIGTGTIGEPLIGLLADNRGPFDIQALKFHKYTPELPSRPKVNDLISRGAGLVVDDDKVDYFRKLGMMPTSTLTEALDWADIIIDCTPKKLALEHKALWYEPRAHSSLGFIAQGSAQGFGLPFVHGVNDAALTNDPDGKFVQVLSCNTHNICVLTNTLGIENGAFIFKRARFMCLRRCSDVSESKSIPSLEPNIPSDERFGTHHAADAHRLFETIGLDAELYSASVKLSTQYMHTIYFTFEYNSRVCMSELKRRLRDNLLIALTQKLTPNEVFAFGRDHGHYGRILNNTVVVEPTLQLSPDGRTLSGYCFTPQDGNSLLSSVAAVLRFIHKNAYADILKVAIKDPRNHYVFQEI